MISQHLIIFILFCSSHAFANIDAICFGNLNITQPIRYFYIQLTQHKKNVTRSLGELDHKITGPCLIRSEIINRHNGLYILRIALKEFCPKFSITVSFQGKLLCNSPILHNFDNECSCSPNTKEWISRAQCESEPQIKSDLQNFPIIRFDGVLRNAIRYWGQAHHSRTYAFCHYQIISNQIYKKCYGEYVDFQFFVDKVLLSIINLVVLPDLEFIFNLGDYPLSQKDFSENIPILSWCSSYNYNDIVVPTYYLAEYLLDKNFEGPTLHKIGIPPIPWRNKLSRAIFRGRDSSILRIELSRLSLENPDLLDAGITTYFFFHDHDNPPTKSRISFNDFFKFRYVISVDGTVAAYRFPLLFAGNSIILKADSPYYEHFYSKLKPYVHFVPFNSSNVEEMISKAKSLDHNQILRNMRKFYMDHLQSKNFYCYYIKLLQEYSARLVDSPSIPSQELLFLEESNNNTCKCRIKAKTEL